MKWLTPVRTACAIYVPRRPARQPSPGAPGGGPRRGRARGLKFWGRTGDLMLPGSLALSTDSDVPPGGGTVTKGSVTRSASGLRVLAPPRLAKHSGATTVRTRLRLSERDTRVLRELGGFLGELASRDLAKRVFLGEEHSTADFARRKRELTALTSSRWAGTITRGSNDQWALARRAQAAHLARLEATIATVSARLAVPIGACHRTTRIEGYPSQAVRAAKQRRLIHLAAEAARVRAQWEQGHVRVVRGGSTLLHTRLHLEQAGLSEKQWRHRWAEARTRIEADGESWKRHGNQSICVTPDGTITIKLPPALTTRYAEFCDARGRYTLGAPCAFAYRKAEWRAQVCAHRAVSYTLAFQDGRCYLTASFTPAHPDLPDGVDDATLMTAARRGGVLGIDHNTDHLTAWRLAPGRARQPGRPPLPDQCRLHRHHHPPRRSGPPRLQ